MDKIVAQDLEITSSRMGSDVSVAGGVFNGAIVGFASIGLVLQMDPFTLILGDEAKVHQIHVVFFSPAITQKQVLSFDIIVNVAAGMDVFQDVNLEENRSDAMIRGQVT